MTEDEIEDLEARRQERELEELRRREEEDWLVKEEERKIKEEEEERIKAQRRKLIEEEKQRKKQKKDNLDTADIFKEINQKRRKSSSRPQSANGSLSSKLLAYVTFLFQIKS